MKIKTFLALLDKDFALDGYDHLRDSLGCCPIVHAYVRHVTLRDVPANERAREARKLYAVLRHEDRHVASSHNANAIYRAVELGLTIRQAWLIIGGADAPSPTQDKRVQVMRRALLDTLDLT